ncbi:uncharacterized protein EI97DRAFT_300734 [Westerdykella ornata]|uniref:Uncharacterized protein n=1 Tax=Westerdykella ornata TaxID=318751 RepID=A0A6A6JN49_WESOR|nr:uncharacterized protein EI97DRAFT_300734 [Westerdykella ornata]KAF2277655.1 hypothetical protein EI97DRAFT_300734 [Westerdykella ornata]
MTPAGRNYSRLHWEQSFLPSRPDAEWSKVETVWGGSHSRSALQRGLLQVVYCVLCSLREVFSRPFGLLISTRHNIKSHASSKGETEVFRLG